MAIKFHIDRSPCDGFGNCVIAADDVFALDEEGLLVLLVDTAQDERLEAARRPACDFPKNAISFAAAEGMT